MYLSPVKGGGGGGGDKGGYRVTLTTFFAIMPVFVMYLETFRCDQLLLIMFDFAIATNCLSSMFT